MRPSKQLRTMLRTVCAIALSLVANVAVAEGEIVLGNAVQKVEYFTAADGSTQSRLVDAAEVVPGDELAYTITFENVSDAVTIDAGSVVITNPVPPEVAYLEATAFGAGTTITYSADDGSLFGSPDQLLIAGPDGDRIADPSEYTHIRWVFEPALEPGQRGSVSFRARLR